MIYSLQKKLIWICGASVVAVFVTIFALICVFSIHQLNSAMDMITDRIAQNDGVFPEMDEKQPLPADRGRPFPDFITEETRFSTRFFTVYFDTEGNVLSVNTESVSSIEAEDAQACAVAAVDKGSERGWLEGYRYRVYDRDGAQAVVFVDGTMNRSVSSMTLLTAGAVLVVSLLVILALIIVFSKRAVRPIAESYEKQKQFITDANHELKTPLTLILTNLDIVKEEIGENEWLEDIRAEGERMNALIQELVTLTRMDEDGRPLVFQQFSLSDAVGDISSEFAALADGRDISLSASVEPWVIYRGDEGALRQVVYILLDNAVKYCDAGGSIGLVLTQKRKTVLTVENSFKNVENVALDKLFDRFYRSDKSRAFTGGFGIGLSIAQSIVHRHHGEIQAYKKGKGRIGFKVSLK
ncbi:MAG: HAMP domain-containing sensor histidine kinase [Eubacterium sp.]|nr:HAMP domain-containing sensor histidine kinase [Eubacterium sp.]